MRQIITVDAMGDQCPIPVVKAKKAIEQAAAGEKILVHVDNEIAVQNLLKLAKSQNCEGSAEKTGEKQYTVTIQVQIKTAAENTSSAVEKQTEFDASKEVCYPDARSHEIAVISSAAMGTGNDELGKVLMKGFLYALSQLDTLPEKVIFYNGGVTLSTEGSDSLGDLKAMEAQGVQILSCGTCLNYYGLTEKLAVGEVTNMYNIVEAMSKASKIIKP